MVIFFPFRFLDVRDSAETLDVKSLHLGLPNFRVRLAHPEGIRCKVAVDKTDDKGLANIMNAERMDDVRPENCEPSRFLSSRFYLTLRFVKVSEDKKRGIYHTRAM